MLLLVSSFGSMYQSSFGQDKILDRSSGQKVDPAMYNKIDGSPYMYEKWVPGEIITTNGTIRAENEMNFNGLTGEIEYRENGERQELMTGSYLKVTLTTDNNNENVFARGLHPEFGMEMVCLLFDGNRVRLVKQFSVRKEEALGSNGTFETFVPITRYFLIQKGQASQISLRQKKILKKLDQTNLDIEAYLSEKDNKLNSESELIEFLKFYDGGI